MSSLGTIGFVNQIGGNHPSSDTSADIELVRKRIDEQDVTIKCMLQKFEQENKSHRAESKRLKAEAQKQKVEAEKQKQEITKLKRKFEQESESHKAESKRLKAEAQKQKVEAEKQKQEITKLKRRLIDLGYIRDELEEKESKHHVFVGINEFYEEKKREIEAYPGTNSEEKEKQMQQLKKIIEKAKKRRSSKILCNAIGIGCGGGVVCGFVTAISVSCATKCACAIATAAFATLGSIVVGAAAVGLIAYGGYLLYVKCHEKKIVE